MSRGRDVNWEISPSGKSASGDDTYTDGGVTILVLMDIREELRRLASQMARAGALLHTIHRSLNRINRPRRITKRQAAKVLARGKRKAR